MNQIQKLPYQIDNDFKSSLPFFHKPDLNHSELTPNTLIDFHLRHNPTYPFAILIDETDGRKDVITWNEFGTAILNLVQTLCRTIQPDVDHPPIVAIITNSEPLTYFTALLAIMRAGCVPFAISPRNSPAAIAHLLKSTDCKHAYVQFNPHLPSSESKEVTEILSRQQIQETLQLLPDAHLPQLHEMPTASDLYTRLAHRSSYQQNLDLIKELDAMPCTTPPAHLPVIMVHSSGTTAFPKPIHVNRLGIQGWLKTSQYGRFNCQAQILASMVLPPFHAMGITFGFLINLTEGSISGLFRPKFNQIGHSKLSTIPNSMNVISAIRDLNCTIASFSPVMLSEIASDPSSVKVLQGLKFVAFGGGPLSASVGRMLVEAGVKLCVMYGSSEVGPIATVFPEDTSKENWEYFEISTQITKKLIQRDNSNTYELVILSSDRHRCSLTYITQDTSPQTYHTNDLLVKHPSLPLYRLVGRLDDQIMLSNSEKTNPGPLEAIIQSHSAVRGALMFGRGKPQNGVIIEPEEAYAFDLTDEEAVEKYLDFIWPSIEEANRFAPTHSRLTRELILLVDPRVTKLTKTSKGQISRIKTLEMLSDSIDSIYQRETKLFSKSFQFEGIESIPIYVEKIVSSVLEREVNVKEDLFVQGCDSLSANQIRNQILQLVKKINSQKSIKAPQNLVYQCSNLIDLSNWVKSVVLDDDDEVKHSLITHQSITHDQNRCEVLQKFILKYSPKLAVENFCI